MKITDSKTTYNRALRLLETLEPYDDLIVILHDNPVPDAPMPTLDDSDSRHISSQKLRADSHYGSTECLEQGENRGEKDHLISVDIQRSQAGQADTGRRCVE